MSEPNSLFAKIHITKDSFDRFLKSNPDKPQLNDDWLAWWDAKEMYDKTDLQEKDLSSYDHASNAGVINRWKEDKSSLTFSDYDEENEIWNFGIIFFSENYFEMIPGLAFIKSVARFKNQNNNDFAILYNYFWGDNYVCAYINYENSEGLFDTKIKNKLDVNSDTLKYTEEYFSKKWDEFAASGLTEEQ